MACLQDPILGSENWTRAFRRSYFRVEIIEYNGICRYWLSHRESSIAGGKDHRDITKKLSAPSIKLSGQFYEFLLPGKLRKFDRSENFSGGRSGGCKQ